jgi:hypothetical protein
MATIYRLSDRLSQSTGSSAGAADRAAGRSATIILFTGVRYERWAVSGEGAAAATTEGQWVQEPASGSLPR